MANDPGSPNSKYVVWHILQTQTEADFVYPAKTGVGAYYIHDSIKLVMGPFSAECGSTWEIHQEEKHSPKLKEGNYHSFTFVLDRSTFTVTNDSSQWHVYRFRFSILAILLLLL